MIAIDEKKSESYELLAMKTQSNSNLMTALLEIVKDQKKKIKYVSDFRHIVRNLFLAGCDPKALSTQSLSSIT